MLNLVTGLGHECAKVAGENVPPYPPWHMRRWAQKLAVIFSTGYILFFYSERMFWSFVRPGDRLADLLLTWAVLEVPMQQIQQNLPPNGECSAACGCRPRLD